MIYTCLTVMMIVNVTGPKFDIVANINSWPEAELTAVSKQSQMKAGCCKVEQMKKGRLMDETLGAEF